MRCSLAIVSACLLWCASPVQAMQFTQESVGTNETFVVGRGPVVAGDATRLDKTLATVQPGVRILALALDSPGGSVTEGEALARLIHARALPVLIAADKQCVSICFLMFAASPQRIAEASALVGVHSAHENGVENDATMAISVQMARIAAGLGVPSEIIGKMVKTQARAVEWLTPADLNLMNVKIYSGDILAAVRSPGTMGIQPSAGSPVPARPPPPAVPVASNLSANFVAGRNDRIGWDGWLNGLQGPFHDGAVVAQLQAGLAAPGACRGPNSTDRGEFTRGCDTARLRLAPAEPRIRNDADYAAGWNSLRLPTQSGQALEAEYRGAYFCGRQVASVTIRLFPLSEDRKRRAVFSFGPQPSSPDVPRGAFVTEGSLEPSAGELMLQPVKWLSHPNGYPWFGLSGRSQDGGKTFSGRVTENAGCSQFTLKRETIAR